MHGEVYSYRIYSPEIDLKNNGYKVKQSIRVIMQAGILFLIAFCSERAFEYRIFRAW